MKNRFEVVGNELLIYVDSKKFGEQVILADKDDLEKLSEYKWHVNLDNHSKAFYAKTHVRKDDGKWMTLGMHRFTMNATDPKFHIDHKNHNTLDNRKCNLQVVSCSENNQNRSKRANSSSGYQGVSFNKRDKKFQVHIRNAEGKSLHLGLYLDPYSAALSYVAAKMVIHSNLVSWQLPPNNDGLMTIEAFVAHLETVRDNPAFKRHILSCYGEPEFLSALSKIDFSTTKLFTNESLANYKKGGEK